MDITRWLPKPTCIAIEKIVGWLFEAVPLVPDLPITLLSGVISLELCRKIGGIVFTDGRVQSMRTA